jgi:transcriptional regulator with XRE-family HTH domain
MPYRKSSIRHPLKRVRSIIGLDQRTVALRAACSTVTIKRIEQGTLALSRPLADKLEAALGVSAAYLRHGKASQPPTTPTGEPFTKDDYQRREMERRTGKEIQSAAFFPFRWAALLGAIASAAGNKNKLISFHYKVEALALELQKEFGIDGAAQRDLLRLCKEPDGFNLLRVGAHDESMPPSAFQQLANSEGLPFRATVKKKTVAVLKADAAKAADAYDKLQARKARRLASPVKRRR